MLTPAARATGAIHEICLNRIDSDGITPVSINSPLSVWQHHFVKSTEIKLMNTTDINTIDPLPELAPMLKQLRLSGITESLDRRNREAIEHLSLIHI